MNDRHPAPGPLRELVEKALPPRATLELDWLDFEHLEWRFRLSWFGERFVLRIPGVHWDGSLLELVSVCASYGAPRPEATLGGNRCSLRFQRKVTGDYRTFEFSVFHESGGQPRVSTIVFTGSAFG